MNSKEKVKEEKYAPENVRFIFKESAHEVNFQLFYEEIFYVSWIISFHYSWNYIYDHLLKI